MILGCSSGPIHCSRPAPVRRCRPFAERIDTAVRQIELAAEQKGEHIAMLEARRHVNCYLKRESGVKTFKNLICALTKLSDLYEIADELKAFVSAKENI